MQAQAEAEAGEVFLAFAQTPLRFVQRDLLETDGSARPKLRRHGKVYRDHVRDFRITTDGLAIPEQQNWFSVRGNLNCSRRDGLGREIARVHPLQRRAIE